MFGSSGYSLKMILGVTYLGLFAQDVKMVSG
jgi:hypothetical protein